MDIKPRNMGKQLGHNVFKYILSNFDFWKGLWSNESLKLIMWVLCIIQHVIN
jgi:hypothetical protein